MTLKQLKQIFVFGGHRASYWSCSKAARWITKTFGNYEKPRALGLEEWGEWRRLQQTNHKFVYWLAEDGLDMIQDALWYPLDVANRIRQYLINRYVDKTHVIPTGLEPGQWHDLDTVILHGMFEALVYFVEHEKAQMQLSWGGVSEDRERLPFTLRHRFFRRWRIKPWGSRELGLKYLEWETTLDARGVEYPNPHQAATAREIILLYKWWKDDRPARPDPYDASGWTEMYERRQAGSDGVDRLFCRQSDEQQEETRAALDRLNQLEQQYEEEDQQMLIRLVKIRSHLWT